MNRRKKLLKLGRKYICERCTKLYASRSGLGSHRCNIPAEYASELKSSMAALTGDACSLRRMIRESDTPNPQLLELFDSLIETISTIAELAVSVLARRTLPRK